MCSSRSPSRAAHSASVPAGPIYRAADIVTDEQYRARAMVQELPVDIDGEQRQVAFPGVVPLLGEASLPLTHPGPDLGADNDWLRRELGLDGGDAPLG